MYDDFKTGAIVVAAGKGKRIGMGINKQYIDLGGKPILAHTLEVLGSTSLIDNIVVVVGEEEIDYCKENIVNKYNIKKVMKIVSGGIERQHSMINGLNALEGMCRIVVTHDGARPLVTKEIVERSIHEARVHGAAACAVAVKDTIKIADKDGFAVSTPERSTVHAVQTPQTFMYDLLYKAHMVALTDGYLGTDDTALVERIGARVKLFEGSYENIKITTPEDIYLAETIIRYRNNKTLL